MTIAVYGGGQLAEVVRWAYNERGFDVRQLEPRRRARHVLLCADTPIGEDGRGDVDQLRRGYDELRPYLHPAALVVVMSQVPVGFTGWLERDWHAVNPRQTFAYVPENIRLATGREDFMSQARIVAGLGSGLLAGSLDWLLAPFTAAPILYMSLESAEMSKHALNSYLGLMVAWSNELGRLSRLVGADPGDVERTLRSEPRISERAPIRPGAPFGLGHIERDIHYLEELALLHAEPVPLLDSILESNHEHGRVTAR